MLLGIILYIDNGTYLVRLFEERERASLLEILTLL